MDQRELIAKLLEERAGLAETVRSLNDKIQTADAKLSDEDQRSFDAGVGRVKEIDARVAELDEQIRSNEAAAELQKRYAAKPGEGVRSEPATYRSGAEGKSFFRDMHNFKKTGDFEARERLVRNNREVAEKRADVSGVTTTTATDFVPPLWIMDKFVTLARAGRVTANLVPTFPLPPGTDSINIPKVATGTAVALQAAQNTGVNVQNLTTSSISSGISTIAGGQVVALQLIEQSPLNIDDVVLQDLAADYAVKLNTQVLSGSGTGGNQTGALTLSGTNAVTVTSGTAITPAQFYTAVANGIQQVHTNRFLPPDVILMTPARWAWLTSQSDTTGRPLVVPAANAPMNAYANQGEVVSQGYVGTMQGLPVYVDALLPSNLGAGTNQDTVIIARISDLMLWEGNLKAETFEQTYANQLSVFIRLYNYASFQPARYPKSISVLGGTGFAGPLFS